MTLNNTIIVQVRYIIIETKEFARIGYNGFLFPHSYSCDGLGATHLYIHLIKVKTIGGDILTLKGFRTPTCMFDLYVTRKYSRPYTSPPTPQYPHIPIFSLSQSNVISEIFRQLSINYMNFAFLIISLISENPGFKRNDSIVDQLIAATPHIYTAMAMESRHDDALFILKFQISSTKLGMYIGFIFKLK